MEQRPAIFKLNLDCFNHVFDYLALTDLCQFGQTCKSMKATVGEYYQANYGTIRREAVLRKEHLYLEGRTMGYSDFIQVLYVYPNRIRMSSGMKRDLSKKVIDLELGPAGFTETQLLRFEYTISHAEVLTIVGETTEEFFDIVPGMCNSLKRLHMRHFQCVNAIRIQDGNRWLLRKYPTLEHLEWTQHRKHGYKINDIKTFFERNPNVRSFATDANCLWGSSQLIIESGIKLDDLTIEVNQDLYRKGSKMVKDELLNELYKKGVYKRLHLDFLDMDDQQTIQQTIDQIIPINAVRSVCLPKVNVNLSKLVNLVELHIIGYGSEVILNVDMMASYLVNLERVHFRWAYLHEMLSFIYDSVKLKKLRVTRFLDAKNVPALDLENMNNRREQLLDASKVTIFIEEKVYLATKWASTLTDYSFIGMKRETAHQWGHHFGSHWHD